MLGSVILTRFIVNIQKTTKRTTLDNTTPSVSPLVPC